MKVARIQLYLFLTFGMMANFMSGQNKDSLISKQKEEMPQNKKRKFVYFVSDRVNEDNKYDIFKIIPSDREAGIVIIKGHVDIPDFPNQKRAKISVYNVSNNELVGIYNTNKYTANYLMVLVPNVKYLFKVEADGFEQMQQVVEVPLKIDYEVGRQEIKILRNEQKKASLFITSAFSEPNEKVFLMRSNPDSEKKGNEEPLVSGELKKPVEKKDAKPVSTIDELVKKQLEEEKKKPIAALKAFKSSDYETALTIYGELIKNDPGDPFLNYYYGTCLLKTNKSKAKAINFLEAASKFPEVPKDVFLNLGKAFHLSYMFNDAYKALEEYKRTAAPSTRNEKELTTLLNNCKSGNVLMADQLNIQVLRRTTAQEDNLPIAYNPEFVNEKLMYKTAVFNSSIDKNKGQKFLMCKAGKNEMVFASYGAAEMTGIDLYVNKAKPDGSPGVSVSLGAEINTPLDENYPYVSKDGKTLYFSSKGHNSMGGYDIFRCTRSDSASPWSKPVNMGFPINSTYDDILYIPDPENRYSSFCTNRKGNGFEYMQIKIPQATAAYSVIKGNFHCADSTNKKDAIITIFNSNNGEMTGVYKTNSETGNYLMVLFSGVSYSMLIETEGYPEMNSDFSVPEKTGDFTLKQTIVLGRENSQSTIKVNNYFTEEQANNFTFENVVAIKEPVKAKTPAIEKKMPVSVKHRTPEEMAKDQQNLKQAKSLYDQSVFQEAALLYKEVSINAELDPMNSYYYGMSLFHAKKDKSECLAPLLRASSGKDVPIDVFYYLGMAGHLSYKFSSAIEAYKKFMTLAKPAEVKKLNIEKEIEYCNNGLKLVNNPVVIEVFEKKHCELESMHLAFTHLESGAKILMSTEDIRSSIDKKKDFKCEMYLSPDKSTIYYTSYGENGDNGKDIYRLKKVGGNKWSPEPFNISTINSPYDEEYPFLSPDGKTLYFSSKGFENMGGYDIFKSTWNEETESWGTPVNMGSPINSPYDDIYFAE
ncbi:MAG: hypothetical protein ACXVPN_12480 [Bacteroidia bacterium]